LFTHKYPTGLFLKISFPLCWLPLYSHVCTFLGTFCLKPHLRRIQGICGYSDSVLSTHLYNQLFNLLCGPALWLLSFSIVFILYSLSAQVFANVYHFLAYPLIPLCLLHHIFLTSWKPKDCFYAFLLQHEKELVHLLEL
jgi:hypothetical protein